MSDVINIGTIVENMTPNGTTLSVPVPAVQEGDIVLIGAAYFASGTISAAGYTALDTQRQSGQIYFRTLARSITAAADATTVTITVPAGAQGTGLAQAAIVRGGQIVGVFGDYFEQTTPIPAWLTPPLDAEGTYVAFSTIYAKRTAANQFAVQTGTGSVVGQTVAHSPVFGTNFRFAIAEITLTDPVDAVVSGAFGGGTATSATVMVFVPNAPAPVDTTAPSVTIDAPLAGQVPLGSLTVSATITDAVGVVSAHLNIPGIAEAVALTKGTGNAWSTSIPIDAENAGTHALTVTALDAAGNAGAKTVQITVAAPVEPEPEPGGIPTFEDAWALEEAPTMTSGSSPQLATTLIPITDPRLVKTGYASGTGGIIGVSSGYYRAPFASDVSGSGTSGNPRMLPTWGFRNGVQNVDALEVAVRMRTDMGTGGNSSLRLPLNVKLNGQWVTLLAGYVKADGSFGMEYDPPVIGQGAPLWLHFDLPEGVTEFAFESNVEIAGIRVNQGGVVTAGSPIEKTAVFVTESSGGALNHGTGSFRPVMLTSADGNGAYATYTNVSAWPHYAGQTIGYDNVVNLGSSGSGAARNGDTIPFAHADRLADALSFPGNLYVYGTVGNDGINNVPTATVNAAFDTIATTIKAAKPEADLVFMGFGGTPEGVTGASFNVEAYDDALKLSSTDNETWFFAPMGGDIIDPDGDVILHSLATVAYNISSDGLHPSQDGSRVYGQGVGRYLAAILGGGVTEPGQPEGLSLVVTSPVAGATLARTFTLVAEIESESDIIDTAWSMDLYFKDQYGQGGANTISGVLTNTGGATWIAAVTVAGNFIEANGPLRVEALNVAGDHAYVEVPYVLAAPPVGWDATAPTVAIDEPLNGSIVTAGVDYPVHATVTDNSGQFEVSLFVNGAWEGEMPLDIDTNAGTVRFSAGEVGPAEIAVVATDSSGNETTATINVTVAADPNAPDPSADRMAPIVKITDIRSTSGGTVVVSAVAADDVAVESATLRVDGVVAGAMTKVANGVYVRTVTLDAAFIGTFEVIAADAAGNSSVDSITLNLG